MEVVCSSDLDPAEYVRFLDGFAERPGTALAYHHPFYLDFLAGVAFPGSTRRLVIARERGTIAGVMPGLHVKRPHVNAWLSLAYFGPNAGALVPNADTPEGTAIVRALVEAAAADACGRECGSMTIYTPLATSAAAYHDALGRVDFDVPKIAQWLTIPADENGSPWPRKVRYDIRRAAALGVTVRQIESERDLDSVWDIYRAGCEEVGIPIKPREHVRHLFRTAGDHGVWLAAEHDGEIIAGLVALIGGGVLSYYLPCSRADKRPLQPGLALLDRAVAIGRKAGCRVLNFEASPGVDSSVFKFKARCGAEPINYNILVKLLRRGVLDEYRALTRAGLTAEVPNAFLVPFEALA